METAWWVGWSEQPGTRQGREEAKMTWVPSRGDGEDGAAGGAVKAKGKVPGLDWETHTEMSARDHPGLHSTEKQWLTLSISAPRVLWAWDGPQEEKEWGPRPEASSVTASALGPSFPVLSPRCSVSTHNQLL